MDIPDDIASRPQWVTWRSVPDLRHPGSKPKKLPMNPHTGKAASTTDPTTWSTLEHALAACERRNHTGVGYVFHEEDGFCGVDLDNCIAEDGTVAAWAQAIIADLNSYSEISPSQRGVKVFVRGTVAQAVKSASIEVYSWGRYFTVTQRHLAGTPTTINAAQSALDRLVATLRPTPQPLPAIAVPPPGQRSHAERWAEERLAFAASEMRGATEGNLHNRRLEMGKLVGGIVVLGLLDEEYAVQTLYNARPPSSHAATEEKAIRGAIAIGRESPLPIPVFPTEQSIILDAAGRGRCPSCSGAIVESKYPYPGTAEAGWYCPTCKHPMVWPRAAYTPSTGLRLVRDDDQVEDDDPAPVSTSRMMHAAALSGLPPADWLIDGMLLARTLHQLYAPPGSGKSYLALDIACCLAHAAVPVVYIAGEALDEFTGRYAAWCEHHTVDPASLPLHFWPDAIPLADPAAVDAFLGEAAPIQPALIIVDPLAECMIGLEESSTGDMQTAVAALNRIRRMLGCAVLVLHHTGWSDTHERGSSVLRGACRLVAKLARSDDGLMKVSIDKQNRGKPIDPLHFRLIEVGHDAVPVPAHRVMVTTDRLTPKQLDILEALTLRHFADGASFSQLLDHTGFAKATINKILHALLSRGSIYASDGRHKFYTISERGQREISDAAIAAEADAPSSPSSPAGELTVNWRVNSPVNSPAEVAFTASYCQVHHSSPVFAENGPEFTSPANSEFTSEFTHSSASECASSLRVHSEFTPSSPAEFTSSPPLRFLKRRGSELGSERTNGEDDLPRPGTVNDRLFNAAPNIYRAGWRMRINGNAYYLDAPNGESTQHPTFAAAINAASTEYAR